MIVLLFLASCQKNYDASDQSTALSPQIGTVPLDVATNIATNFFKMYYENVDNKPIDNQVTVDENGVPYFYLFNYKNGGFLIVSAEYGDMPILANDVAEVFPSKGEKINTGLGMWLIETSNRIKAIRSGKEKPKSGAAALWNDLKNKTYKADFKYITIDDIRRNTDKAIPRDTRELPHNNDNCSSYSWTNRQVGPFTVTRWDQGCGYNALVPTDHLGDCGHAPAGCVAVSMAQIVRFHSFPPLLGIDYSTMPNTLPRIDVPSQVAQIIASFGSMINTTYATNGSGAQTSHIEWALEFFGYSTDASYGVYNSNYWQHRNNLDAGRPVILDGCTDYSCFFGFWCWGTGDCHAWVSDGYQASSHPCYGESYSFRMNWGWGGRSNGFYYSPIPDPTAIGGNYYNFQYERNMLYNIHL